MTQELSSSAQRVQEALAGFGMDLQVMELTQSTRTSAEAALAVGCDVGQIAKSLIFRARQSGQAVLVIASGRNRVDEKRVAVLLGEAIGKADADFVRAATGFVIGGVPPVGHSQPLQTLIDGDLLAYDEIWAAAGTPNALFRLAPAELVTITGGTVGEVKREA
ncbi:MAG: YbaK/EbsC family protein [Caldilineaceae bacterium]|nr:YbaK/EbsC family protein [Caldilineaceae bacterium]HRJ42747.1 YbaK/EbsC family protein [Caldilineaceae bacterium]